MDLEVNFQSFILFCDPMQYHHYCNEQTCDETRELLTTSKESSFSSSVFFLFFHDFDFLLVTPFLLNLFAFLNPDFCLVALKEESLCPTALFCVFNWRFLFIFDIFFKNAAENVTLQGGGHIRYKNRMRGNRSQRPD